MSYWGSNRQIGTNEVVWKPTTEKLYYVKQRCLRVQGASSLTNISQSQQPKHQSERIQKHSEDFYKFVKSKWLPHHSKISGVFMQKKCYCLQHTKSQNISIYNLLFKHNSKKYLKLISVNYPQLNTLLFQSKTCF